MNFLRDRGPGTQRSCALLPLQGFWWTKLSSTVGQSNFPCPSTLCGFLYEATDLTQRFEYPERAIGLLLLSPKSAQPTRFVYNPAPCWVSIYLQIDKIMHLFASQIQARRFSPDSILHKTRHRLNFQTPFASNCIQAYHI